MGSEGKQCRKLWESRLYHVKGSIIMMLRGVETNFVSLQGVTPLDCRRFCAEKASDFNKSQQLSTSGPLEVQYQSLGNNKFQQVSISVGIWFGTRGSEVQILSPRPLFSAAYSHLEKIKTDPLGLGPGALASGCA